MDWYTSWCAPTKSASPNLQAYLLAYPSAFLGQAPRPVHHAEHHSGQGAYRQAKVNSSEIGFIRAGWHRVHHSMYLLILSVQIEML